MMDKFRIALSFIKITFTNISNTLLKSATGYIVASFALIQVSSIVTDNISMIDLLGLPKEIFMQYMFISLTVLFPIFLIFTFIFKRKK